MNPDSIVASHGETVTLHRVTVVSFNSDDVFDEAASTITSSNVKAVASMPSEKELRAFQGRIRIPTLRLTVDSGLDVSVSRNGRPDRVTRGGIIYQVEEVRDDRHPITGTRKKTVYLAQMPGR